MAATVSFSLIAQLGEQVDYLRFLPDLEKNNRRRWWLAVILAGPGWIILGCAKQLGGAFLAFLALQHGVTISQAKEPIQMYLAGFTDMFSNPQIVLLVGTIFVIVSQIKINVTNAYAGSLAWSNFFSRLTHSHPGRVVWLVFNVAIALLLMELGVFETLEAVLGLYSNVAIAWVGALVADLVINKPLGISPSYIEFKRAYLYNINPVGFGAMAIASAISILAFLGIFGEYAQAYSAFLALGIALILSPAIAFLTGGKYYIARENTLRYTSHHLLTCCICEQNYEPADTAFCPVYDGPICSLCCTLDAHCHDRCKPELQIQQKSFWAGLAKKIFRDKISPQLGIRIFRFVGIFLLLAGGIGAIFAISYYQNVWQFSPFTTLPQSARFVLFWQLYTPLLLACGLGAWWLVLSEESRELAEDELDKQNQQLQGEIHERQRAEAALKALTHDLEDRVEQRTAELQETVATLKKAQMQLVQSEKLSSLGQLVAGVAHEINNPVNFIHGNLEHATNYVNDLLSAIALYQKEYSHPSSELQELLQNIELDFIEEDLPKLLASMNVGTERIRKIVLSLRVFSRVDESEVKLINIHEGIDSTLMILGNRLKANTARPAIEVLCNYNELPWVECYAGQLNQVFMNLLANAIDAFEESNRDRTYAEIQTHPNQITITTSRLNTHWIRIDIADNGPGIPEPVRDKIFDAFFTTKNVGQGTGLGLSICYQIITEKHQGRLTCLSQLGQGTVFRIEIPIHSQALKGEKNIEPKTVAIES
ncbi:MAG: ATP-binding protein [Jaaginema sp. PMC 1079.18]|nr:ATP-binding protein [Jaaginema sp. PMC 1080.18]MEC4849814.1 ATP-binding protein [Jaaginema sp. PMC 1079.18]MEC4865258.1 ATP-binding protein [Jaaginema sp. PMC 1078.18]